MSIEIDTSKTDARTDISNGPCGTIVCAICGSTEVVELLAAPDRFHWRKEIYQLVRCRKCTCVSLASPPQPEEMGVHYDEDYHNAIVASGGNSNRGRWKNEQALISRYKQRGAILDVGCSSGGFLSTMKSNVWKLYGIEMEESTAVKARAATGAQVFVGDAVEAPFPPETFDVVTSFDLLEHMYDPVEFVKKVRTWLKPGGIFVALLPNIDSWEAQLFGSYWYGLELPRHLFHFTPKSLRHLMAAEGFEEVYLATPPISYIERSVGYVCSRLIEKVGLVPTPQAKPTATSLVQRALRKGARLSFVAPFARIASWAKSGPSMNVIFRKSG